MLQYLYNDPVSIPVFVVFILQYLPFPCGECVSFFNVSLILEASAFLWVGAWFFYSVFVISVLGFFFFSTLPSLFICDKSISFSLLSYL